ncbi:MAG: Alpha-L-fucosidase [Chloroflexi bacterium ADurb.Bin325]|nr:MAG: Alpha-L-fucosidase [Chloroflexi bacterium ADurb.Bin325]
MYHPKPTAGDTSWFVHDRFGMFIHWGLYALPARHEWVRHYEEIPNEAYEKYFENFNPHMFDPVQWARTAWDAGMRYVVLTTKHHEGFCLWDTQYTDYKVTNTPYGKEILRPFVEAFRSQGFRIGFYYSLIDWHHPEFPIDGIHPLRNHPDALEMNKSRDVRKYAEYMRNQVRELLTNYGQVDVLWCDFSYPGREYKGMPGKGRDDWESEKLVALIRELQPKILLDDRLDLPGSADIYTPEQYQPAAWVRVDGEPVVWEACQTFSGSWGYHRDEATWKDAGQLVRMLVNTVATGGNLLMNVGPTPLGTWDSRALDALKIYEEWMKFHGEAIYGCTQSEFTAPADCRLTQNGDKLYLHIYAWPFRYLLFEGMGEKVKFARFLHDGSEVLMNAIPDWQLTHFGLDKSALVLTLPVKQPNTVVPVIELTLK